MKRKNDEPDEIKPLVDRFVHYVKWYCKGKNPLQIDEVYVEFKHRLLDIASTPEEYERAISEFCERTGY